MPFGTHMPDFQQYRKVVPSTNGELLNQKWPIGSSLSTDLQTDGRGRYAREWTSTPELLACSWKIGKQSKISPEILQILCGYVVKNRLNPFRITILIAGFY